MKREKVKIGDVFEINLRNSQRAYGQYIYWDENGPTKHGCLIRIYNIICPNTKPIEEIVSADILFPPVFMGLKASIRSGRWRIIGNVPVTNFSFPLFRVSFHTKPGVYHDWKIQDHEKCVFIGTLPEEYRSLEILTVWGDEMLEERIMTGTNPHEHVW